MAVPIYNQRSDDDYDEEVRKSISFFSLLNILVLINEIPFNRFQYAEDNVDIAASIKALAKSVHGEAIFGDLPRPRFSTQI